MAIRVEENISAPERYHTTAESALTKRVDELNRQSEQPDGES